MQNFCTYLCLLQPPLYLLHALQLPNRWSGSMRFQSFLGHKTIHMIQHLGINTIRNLTVLSMIRQSVVRSINSRLRSVKIARPPWTVATSTIRCSAQMSIVYRSIFSPVHRVNTILVNGLKSATGKPVRSFSRLVRDLIAFELPELRAALDRTWFSVCCFQCLQVSVLFDRRLVPDFIENCGSVRAIFDGVVTWIFRNVVVKVGKVVYLK